MAIIATDSMRYSNLVKREDGPEWGQCKKMVVLNGPAGTFPIGTVIGQVTATGKFKVVEATATDGSQVASAVIVGDFMGHPVPVTVAANTDTKFLVLYRGICGVADKALTFGASVTPGALTTTAYAQLAAVGIDVLPAI
jgi:hypothetical protein